MTSCAIGVMAKTPQSGRSKTRLCPPLLPDQAAALSGAFLRDTIDNLEIAAQASSIISYAAYAPLGSEDELKNYLKRNTKLLLADGSPSVPDGVEGFGRSLLHAIQGMFSEGHDAACVLSSDCPTLPTRLLQKAADILLTPGDRAVLGACQDGGYYLLGLKAQHADFFKNILWSTSEVAEQTRIRARDAGVELVELDPWYDVDDLSSLRLLMAEHNGYPAPITKNVIERLGLSEWLETRSVAEVSA